MTPTPHATAPSHAPSDTGGLWLRAEVQAAIDEIDGCVERLSSTDRADAVASDLAHTARCLRARLATPDPAPEPEPLHALARFLVSLDEPEGTGQRRTTNLGDICASARRALAEATRDPAPERDEDEGRARRLALRALEGASQRCRFHGDEFGRSLGWERGEPRCDSCKQPYRVAVALTALRKAHDTRKVLRDRDHGGERA